MPRFGDGQAPLQVDDDGARAAERARRTVDTATVQSEGINAVMDLNGDGVVSAEEITKVLDEDSDGIISKEEWERGQKLMTMRFSHELEVDMHKITRRLMFEDEKRTCAGACCLFFMFTFLYIVVLSYQVRRKLGTFCAVRLS